MQRSTCFSKKLPQITGAQTRWSETIQRVLPVLGEIYHSIEFIQWLQGIVARVVSTIALDAKDRQRTAHELSSRQHRLFSYECLTNGAMAVKDHYADSDNDAQDRQRTTPNDTHVISTTPPFQHATINAAPAVARVTTRDEFRWHVRWASCLPPTTPTARSTSGVPTSSLWPQPPCSGILCQMTFSPHHQFLPSVDF